VQKQEEEAAAMLDEFVASFAADEDKGSGGGKTFVRGETFVPHTVLDKASATSTASSGKIYKPAPKIKTAAAVKQEETPAAAAAQDKSARSIDELKDMFIKCVRPPRAWLRRSSETCAFASRHTTYSPVNAFSCVCVCVCV
jgi:hypothetical protein